MRITRDEAEAYFTHPTQRKWSKLEGPLPDACTYYAQGNICFAFHWFWSGVLMAHFGAQPDGWGKLIEPAKAILLEAWEAEKPERIVGWNREENRAVQAFCRKIGAKLDGRLELPDPVMMYGWRP